MADVILSWSEDPNDDAADEASIERDSVEIDTVSAGVEQYTDVAVPSGNYTYRVRMRDVDPTPDAHSAYSNVININVPGGPPPPPPPSGNPNEPAGMTKVADNPWNMLSYVEPSGVAWWERGAATISSTPELTAPYDPPNVLQQRFPAGMIGGNSGGNQVVAPKVNLALPSGFQSPQEIYVRNIFMLSSNWWYHPTGGKLFYLGQGPHPRIALIYAQTGVVRQGTNHFVVALEPDNTKCGHGFSVNLHQNVDRSVLVQPGKWHDLEIYAKLNNFTSDGSQTCNAIVKLWLDGTLILHHSPTFGKAHLQADRATFSSSLWHWQNFDYNPVWGGIGSQIPETQFLWTARTYISLVPHARPV